MSNLAASSRLTTTENTGMRQPMIRRNHLLRRVLTENRAALGTLGVFVVMMAVFVAANPAVFTDGPSTVPYLPPCPLRCLSWYRWSLW